MSKSVHYTGTDFRGKSIPQDVHIDGRTLRHAGTDLKIGPDELNGLINKRDKEVMKWLEKEASSIFDQFDIMDHTPTCWGPGFGGMGPGTRYAVVDKNDF